MVIWESLLLVSNVSRLLNLVLRGTTMCARFLFVFALAKYLDPALVGYYGIFTATVGYAMYFVGLDFYTYVSREIIKTPSSRRGQLLKAQMALSGILYVLLLPVGIWLLSHSTWPSYLMYWFLPILVLEHFNQEVSRLLVALSHQLTSSVILFIRQGSWAFVIISLMYADTTTRSLNGVMVLWMVAGMVAAILGVGKLKRLSIQGWDLPIDWRVVKQGISVSVGLLTATLALRGVQTFDRYWLDALGGIQMVGAYVLFMGIAGTLLTVLDASVFAFAYPNLIHLHHQNQPEEAYRQVKRLFWQTLMVSFGFGVVSVFLLPYFLAWIGNTLYLQVAHWYFWVLAAMTLNAISMVPHFALYARGADKPIIYSHIMALIVFVIVTALLSHTYNLQAILIGLNAAFGCILIWKMSAYLNQVHQQRQIGWISVHA